MKPITLSLVCLMLCLGLAACGGSTPSPAPAVLPGPQDSAGYPAPTAANQPTAAYPAPGPGGAAALVTLGDDAITPATLTISAGTTVQFLVKSDSGAVFRPYSVEPAGLFEAEVDLYTGQSYLFTLKQAGTYQVGCRNHPGLSATIVVNP